MSCFVCPRKKINQQPTTLHFVRMQQLVILSTTTGMRILPRQIFGGLSLMSQSRVTCKHIETPSGILIVLTFLCFKATQNLWNASTACHWHILQNDLVTIM